MIKYRKTTELEKKVLKQLGFEIQNKVKIITKEERELLDWAKKQRRKMKQTKTSIS